MSQAAEEQEPAATQVQLGESLFYGVFDKGDLQAARGPFIPAVAQLASQAFAPVPVALFETEEEAQGFVLLSGLHDTEPVIRRCTVRGTVTLLREDVS